MVGHMAGKQEEAEMLLEIWQRRLRLLDWDIRVDVKRAKDMSHDDSLGLCFPNPMSMSALIELLDPVDDTDSEPVPYNLEQTLVHELLHIPLAGTALQDEPDDKYDHIMFERWIDRLAWALVDAYKAPKRNGHSYRRPDGFIPPY